MALFLFSGTRGGSPCPWAGKSPPVFAENMPLACFPGAQTPGTKNDKGIDYGAFFVCQKGLHRFEPARGLSVKKTGCGLFLSENEQGTGFRSCP